MANHKTGKTLICPFCSKEFYIPRARLLKYKNHYCSLKCLARFTAKQRSKKLRKKNYPFVIGKCLLCSNDIIVKNSYFDKPNRKFCSVSCFTSYKNKHRIWKQSSKDKIAEANRKYVRTMEYRKKMSEIVKQRVKEGRHNTYKGGITPFYKKIRNCFENVLWRNFVFMRDDYTCQKCGRIGGNLKGHHIFSVNKFLNLIFYKENGITFCKECHNEFHKKYSKGNNNLKQLIEFLNLDWWWKQITDEMAFNPEIALDWFWKIFPKEPHYWIAYKSGAFKRFL